MKFFNKSEIKTVSIILFFIFIACFFNFRISIRRARDNTRKNDFNALVTTLQKYQSAFGEFPLSSDNGKILACKGDNTVFDKKLDKWINLRECEWAKDSLADFSDPRYPPDETFLPADPYKEKGLNYIYLSNGSRYQLLAHLEGKDEAEYDVKIEARGISCGNDLCNYGIGFSSTPLDKSIEEYENEIIEKEKSNK